MRPAVLSLLFLLLISRVAGADPGYSDYERETIEQALEDRGGAIEVEPVGKRIESIEVVTLDAIEQRDPVPGFLNVFHVTTRDRLIRRELLFAVGQKYEQSRVDTTARNLRAIRQLSLVLIVPLRGTSADGVRILVITKDVWSLRLSSDFQISSGGLAYLLIQPSEENLLGTHTSFGALFTMSPDVYSLGGQLNRRRIAGSRMDGLLGVNLVFNRDTGQAEGSFGSFYYGQPLFSPQSRWAWKAAVLWNSIIRREFIGLEPRLYEAEGERLRYAYATDRWLSTYGLTRSFGLKLKLDISAGMEADHRRYGVLPAELQVPGDPPASSRAVDSFVANEMPVSDTRLSPFFQIRSYGTRYIKVLHLNTLGLQEDYRLGHELLLRVFPASRHVGSSRNLLGTFAAASYTVPYGDGMTRAVLAHTAMFEGSAERSDASLQAGLRIVSPRLGFGRLLYDGVLLSRYHNYLNEFTVLGGGDRLRGYPLNILRGKDVVAGSFELRSRPLSVLAQQLGAAAFFDAGDAFDGFEQMRIKYGVGMGLRMLFPQAERIVMRADWGFPLSSLPGRSYSFFPGSFFLTFGQAFPTPTIAPPLKTSRFGWNPE